MSIKTTVLNFKTKLSNIFFLKSLEESEWLKWYNNNITYTNGYLKVLTSNNKTNYTLPSNNPNYTYKKLVSLLKEWFNDKMVKQDVWFNVLGERMVYVNGGLYVNSIIPVSQSLTFNYEFTYSTNVGGVDLNVYSFTAQVNPCSSGQVLLLNGYIEQTFTFDKTGLVKGNFSLPKGNRQVTLYVQEYTVDDYKYVGLMKIFTIR